MQNKEEMFNLRFIKLGFDKKKSIVAKFDKSRIQERLEQIELLNSGTILLPSITLEQVKAETNQVFSNLFQGLGLKVDTFQDELEKPNQEVINEVEKINILFANRKITPQGIADQLLMVYKRNSKKTKVFDVPVKPLKGQDSMQAFVIKGPLLMAGDAERMAVKAPVYFESISLGEKYDQLSVGTYGHEITHMLLDRHKGIIGNYYNDEFLSIFMEKVCIDSVDSSSDKFFVKCAEVYRLAHLKQKLGELENYKEDTSDYKECIKYIQGALYAGILFDRYSKSDNNQKQEILEQVKSVFNGITKLDDFIKNQQLSLENDDVFKYIDKVADYTLELKERRKTELDFEASEMSSEAMQIEALRNSNSISSNLLSEENSHDIED